jgi:hypothetical protein
LGGRIVLSAIFAQSLMIVNLPYKWGKNKENLREKAYNHAVFPDLDVVSDSGGFYHRA